MVTNGGGATGSLAIQLSAAMGVEVTTTASASAADRLRGLGAAEIIDYHDPNWPGQVRGGFDGTLIAAIGTGEAALPLVRDGRRPCSLTSDAPAEERGIASTDLYVRPDAAQLAQLVKQVSEGTLQLTPEVHPLREGPGRVHPRGHRTGQRQEAPAHPMNRLRMTTAGTPTPPAQTLVHRARWTRARSRTRAVPTRAGTLR